jgi:predicted small secreted protein
MKRDDTIAGKGRHNRNTEGDYDMKTTTGLLLALLVFALIGIGAAGCNTFKGAGKDIQQGGEAVEKAADDTQKGLEQPRTHTIAASADSGGTISPPGTMRIASGSNRTFTIKANSGYHVADVLVDGASVGAVSRYTFENVKAHHTILALFTANPK